MLVANPPAANTAQQQLALGTEQQLELQVHSQQIVNTGAVAGTSMFAGPVLSAQG
jgi:hypothetical protein